MHFEKTTEYSTSLDAGCEQKRRIREDCREFSLGSLQDGASHQELRWQTMGGAGSGDDQELSSGRVELELSGGHQGTGAKQANRDALT